MSKRPSPRAGSSAANLALQIFIRRAVVWLSLCALLFACDDSSLIVGHNPCHSLDSDAGGGCIGPHMYLPKILPIAFVDVPTDSPANLSVLWRVARTCVGCTAQLQINRAGPSTVWSIPRDQLPPAIELIDGNGKSSAPLTLGPPPNNSGTLNTFSMTSDSTGTAVVHAQWNSLSNTTYGPESIFTVADHSGAGSLVPSETLSMTLGTQRARLPIAALNVPQGLLFYNGGGGGPNISLYDVTGRLVQRSGPLPGFSKSIGTSVVMTGSGFLAGAGDGDLRQPIFGLLTLGMNFEFQQFAKTSSSTWRSVIVQPWSRGEYIAVASSDLLVAGLPGAGEGNIDVVMSTGSEPVPSGWRLRRACSNRLTVYGLSTNEITGNIYVSTVSGNDTAPRGLICRLPPLIPGVNFSGTQPKCWQSAVNERIGQISAADDGTVFAVLSAFSDTNMGEQGTQIARLSLPE